MRRLPACLPHTQGGQDQIRSDQTTERMHHQNSELFRRENTRSYLIYASRHAWAYGSQQQSGGLHPPPPRIGTGHALGTSSSCCYPPREDATSLVASPPPACSDDMEKGRRGHGGMAPRRSSLIARTQARTASSDSSRAHMHL
jgi:hypothetical protein